MPQGTVETQKRAGRRSRGIVRDVSFSIIATLGGSRCDVWGVSVLSTSSDRSLGRYGLFADAIARDRSSMQEKGAGLEHT